MAVLMLLQLAGAFYERPLNSSGVDEQQECSDEETQKADKPL